MWTTHISIHPIIGIIYVLCLSRDYFVFFFCFISIIGRFHTSKPSKITTTIRFFFSEFTQKTRTTFTLDSYWIRFRVKRTAVLILQWRACIVIIFLRYFFLPDYMGVLVLTFYFTRSFELFSHTPFLHLPSNSLFFFNVLAECVSLSNLPPIRVATVSRIILSHFIDYRIPLYFYATVCCWNDDTTLCHITSVR